MPWWHWYSICRANAKLVYACEWNPHAIKALQHNIHANFVADRCIILEGDNHVTAPKVCFFFQSHLHSSFLTVIWVFFKSQLSLRCKESRHLKIWRVAFRKRISYSSTSLSLSPHIKRVLYISSPFLETLFFAPLALDSLPVLSIVMYLKWDGWWTWVILD